MASTHHLSLPPSATYSNARYQPETRAGSSADVYGRLTPLSTAIVGTPVACSPDTGTLAIAAATPLSRNSSARSRASCGRLIPSSASLMRVVSTWLLASLQVVLLKSAAAGLLRTIH